VQKPSPKTGIARIVSAFYNSLKGLRSCFQSEAAFRQESILFILLVPVIFLMPVTPLLKLLLFAANTLVLIVELLNSAVEELVDMVSPDYDERAGRAKDIGSAAVLASLVTAAAFWVYALAQVFS